MALSQAASLAVTGVWWSNLNEPSVQNNAKKTPCQPLAAVQASSCRVSAQPRPAPHSDGPLRRCHVSSRQRCLTPLAQANDTATATEQHEGEVEDEEEEEEEEECELVLGSNLELLKGSSLFSAHLAKPVKNRNGAGVLLLTDVMGYEDSDTRDFAYRIACFGYSVLIPDLFQGRPWNREDPPEPDFDTWRKQQNSAKVAATIDAAADYLKHEVLGDCAHPGEGRMAVLGFCFGGGHLLPTLARSSAPNADVSFSTGVMFYGTDMDVSLADQISVPIALITGDQDPLCGVQDFQDLQQRIAGSELRVFEGRKHAFAHHPGSVEDDEAAEEAFAMAKQWLHDHLLMGAQGPWGEKEKAKYKLQQA